MITLPFNKWTLDFTQNEFEIEFQEQQNKVRLLGFKILNLSMIFAALMTLIIFVIQEQPFSVVIIMTGVVIGCFSLFILSSRLEPYLKHVFSGMYIWSVSTNILISIYTEHTPNYFFGFNCSFLAFGTMQFSQNRLKFIYSILTPVIMTVVFQVYEPNSMQYIFHAISCWSFVCVLTYMFEYTSRLAFSLNKITNYQQTIVNEYVNDPLLAVSVDKRTRQFNLEFKNKQLDESLNIQSTNEMKQFLRSSYIINQNQSESLRKLSDKSFYRSSRLEEVLWIKFQSNESFMQQEENLFDIGLISKEDDIEVEKQLKIQIKLMNFGKPILLIVIKSYEKPQIKDKYEQLIQYNKTQFITFSQQLINSLTKLSNEIGKTKSLNVQNYEKVMTLRCLSLQIINYARNFNMFYQIGRIFQQNNLNQQCYFNEFLSSISQYFNAITQYNGQKYQILNSLQKSYIININLKYLAQLLINIFEEFIKILEFKETIFLKVFEEQVSSQQQQLKTQQNFKSINKPMESSQANSKQFSDQRLIVFSFYFLTKNRNTEMILKFLRNKFDSSVQQEDFEYDEITKEITFQLLNTLGPIDKIEFKIEDESEILRQKSQQRISITFKIYSDQTKLESSYYRIIKKAYCAQFRIQ